jgi:hypothetical protein
MRAGYDGVYSDTRRPPIPDLPISDKFPKRNGDGANRTSFPLIAALMLALTVVGGVMLLTGTA